MPSPRIRADLLSKLSGERSRWAQQLAALDGQLAELPRAALAVAAFITYLPAHPEDVRERVMQDWTRCGCGCSTTDAQDAQDSVRCNRAPAADTVQGDCCCLCARRVCGYLLRASCLLVTAV